MKKIHEAARTVDVLLETDVLVVGAGPAGSSAAAWSARTGREVLLADADPFRG